MGANSERLTLAAKAGRTAAAASRENESYRIASKLSRNPSDIEALSKAIVYEAKIEGIPFSGFFNTPEGFALLQFALEQVSYLLWERLWNETHPNQSGQAWEGEDLALMSAWRKQVRILIEECHQESILAMHADEYVARLMDARVGEEAAKGLTEWLSQVVYEEPTDSE